MPLLDHFRSPWSPDWPWDGVHASWAASIAEHLNRGVLPPDYHAIPLIKRGGQVEIDVAALQQDSGGGAGSQPAATATWAPPRAAITRPVEFSEDDVFEVQVLRRLGGAQLRAAVELVSPANKDRPASRRAFVTKCASYLAGRVSVVVIDVVTERLANLHAELFQLLGLNGELPWESPTHLYAVAYRIAAPNGQRHVEVWQEALALGAALPTLPLWLDAGLCVPLRLEESYTATCTALRIPV
jgi:hypothetical protein